MQIGINNSVAIFSSQFWYESNQRKGYPLKVNILKGQWKQKKAIQTIVGWLGWGFMHFISKMILKGEGNRSAVLKKNRLIPPTAKAWQGVEGYISIRIAHVCPTKERKCPFSKFRAILFLCGKKGIWKLYQYYSDFEHHKNVYLQNVCVFLMSL